MYKLSINMFSHKFIAILKGQIYRKLHLPNSLIYIQKILKNKQICTNTTTNDGRVNSCLDEQIIINFLQTDELLKNRIYIPKSRCWYDILVKDYRLGWIPINIKSSTLTTADNFGNFGTIYYSIINNNIDLEKDKHIKLNNGSCSNKVINGFKNNTLNYTYKDYYFLVINKTNTTEILINSIKGLTILTSNNNNLPFQINWKYNKKFKYQSVKTIKNKIIKTIQNPKPTWKEIFLQDIRKLKIT